MITTKVRIRIRIQCENVEQIHVRIRNIAQQQCNFTYIREEICDQNQNY